MVAKPCKCTWNHRFTRSEAKRLDGRCNRDGTPITCSEEVSDDPPAPLPSGAEANGDATSDAVDAPRPRSGKRTRGEAH